MTGPASPSRTARRPATRYRRAALGLAVLALALAPLSALPKVAAPAALSPSVRADVVRIERYLNQLKTVEARFLQVSSNGGIAGGKLLLLRPGRLRIVYDPPSKIEIIADGTYLIYVDKELEQVTRVDLEDTPAAILTKAKISFVSGDYRVKKLERGANALRLTVERADDPEAQVTLVFSDKPLTLKKWVVKDAQGVLTTVSLLNPRFGVPLSPKLFRFENPYEEQFPGDS